MPRRARHLLILVTLIVGLVPLSHSLAAAAAPRAVLCDRSTSAAVIERRYFDARCPRGWRNASRGPVLCSRGAGLERKTFSRRCPAGWILIVIEQGLICRIANRSYSCRLTPGATRPTSTVPATTVAPTRTTVATTRTTVPLTIPATTVPPTTAAPTTTTTTPTVAPTTTTTVAPTTTTLPPSASFDARGWEAEILRLTNEERQSAGLNPVAGCSRLATAALLHSNRMLEGQFFAHDDPGTGTKIVDRIRSTGYLDSANGWSVGENIAMGYSTANATMVGWMNSPGHRANILTPGFTHLGVGVSIGIWEAWRGTYSNWNSATMATQNFGFGGSC